MGTRQFGCCLLLAGSVVLWPAGLSMSQEKTKPAGAQSHRPAGAPLVDTIGKPGRETESQPPGQNQSKQPTAGELKATAALFEHFQKNQINLRKDTSGPRLIWTDTALIEITDTLPPDPLGKFLNLLHSDEGVLAKWVHDTYETHLQEWHPARRSLHPGKPGTDEIIDTTGGHCYVNPIYLSYILARHPQASLLIKTPTDPVIFTVEGQICAVLAPWTKLPDGTPLL